MANLAEVSQWENVIRQIENGEAATGGADGLANVQAKQLANRTKYLKDQISTINTYIYNMPTNGTFLNHNGIFRGKNLGVLDSLSAVEGFLNEHNVSRGGFDDLYLGDYFTIKDGTYNAEWEIVGFNVYYHKGDTDFNNNHVVLMPKKNLLTSKMNDTDDTTGGYYGSYIHQTVIPTIDDKLAIILREHLLSRRAFLSDSVDKSATGGSGANLAGASRGGNWYTVKSCLASEVAIYGSRIFSSSPFDIGEDSERLPLFQFRHNSYSRQWFWLRGVAAGSAFVLAAGMGSSNTFNATKENVGVLPIICVG